MLTTNKRMDDLAVKGTVVTNSIGSQIGRGRKNLRMTQKQLASQILKADGTPISPQYLNDLELDKRGAPPNYLLDRISEALGLPQEYLRFVAGRLPADLAENYHREHDPETVKTAFEAFRKALAEGPA